MNSRTASVGDRLRDMLSPRARGQRPREDASSLIGMQTRGASLLALVYVLLSLWAALEGTPFARPWVFAIAFALLVLGLGLLVYAPGDPLAGWATMLVTVTPGIQVALTVSVLAPEPRLALTVMANGAAVIQAFLCIRRRPVFGWLSLLVMVVLVVPAAAISGMSLITVWLALLTNVAVVAIASMFTTIVRPTADSLSALRVQTAEGFAAQAADIARLRERDAQLSHLDRRVRPMLEQIATGAPLTPDQVRECGLIEAQLRDRIRAPGLAERDFEDVVARARARGVRVRQLDDSNPPRRLRGTALTVMRIRISGELDRLSAGDEVIVRILPRGRDRLGTVQITGADKTRRVEYGLDGRLASERESTGSDPR